MKTTKRRFEQFVFYDYTGIEAHLARMVAKGWQLHKITPFYWEYRKIEPQKLAYTVTYFSEASEFNPYPTENQQTFHEYCRDAGWELVTEWAQMQIFCTEQEKPTPIETEESVKLKAIHKSMKKNFLPSSIFMLLLSLFQISFQVYAFINSPVDSFSNSFSLLSMVSWSVLTLFMLINLICYLVWYRQSVKAVEMGEIEIKSSSSHQKLSHALLNLVIALMIVTIFSTSTQRFALIAVLGFINVAAVISLVLTVKNRLKRGKASRKVNLSVTVISSVLFSLLFTGAMTWVIIRGIDAGWFGSESARTHTITLSNGATYTRDIYQDSLPLKVEDLQEVDYEHYSYEGTESETFLVALYVARQDAFPDDQPAPTLNYAIVDVKLPVLFDIILNDYLDMYDYDWNEPDEYRRYFRKTDDPMWQADSVYQLYRSEEAKDEYILCWGNRIVYINFEEIPTAGQIAVTVERLSK